MRRSVLAVFAHPDDESLLAGGTLAACAQAGYGVEIVSITCGELGPIAAATDAMRVTLGSHRGRELEAAGRALGAAGTRCLNYPDGMLAWGETDRVVADVADAVRQAEPVAIFTFGPDGVYWHPDHIAVHHVVQLALRMLQGELPMPAVYYATMPLGLVTNLYTAMSARGLSGTLWDLDPDAFGVPEEQITHVVNVSSYLAAKLIALRCHATQLGENHLLRTITPDLAERYLGHEYFVQGELECELDDWLIGLGAIVERSG